MPITIKRSQIDYTPQRGAVATAPVATIGDNGILSFNSFVFRANPNMKSLRLHSWDSATRKLQMIFLPTESADDFPLTSPKIKKDGNEVTIAQYRTNLVGVLRQEMFGDVEGINYDYARSGSQKFELEVSTTKKGVTVYTMVIPKGVHPDAPTPEELARKEREKLAKKQTEKTSAPKAVPVPVPIPADDDEAVEDDEFES